MTTYLNVAEIFKSFDGEVNNFYQGRRTVFLRLAGCNFGENKKCPACQYCDTKKYQDTSSGTKMTVKMVADAIDSLGGNNLTITGGEPLLQQNKLNELYRFLNKNKKIVIETNGSVRINPHLPFIFEIDFSFVVDYKLEEPQIYFMNKENWTDLNSKDFIKMVVDEQTLPKAIDAYYEIRLNNRYVNIAFSPKWDDPKDRPSGIITQKLANSCKMIADELENNNINDIVLNIQLHKIAGFS